LYLHLIAPMFPIESKKIAFIARPVKFDSVNLSPPGSNRAGNDRCLKACSAFAAGAKCKKIITLFIR
jgi:hypothetical protein